MALAQTGAIFFQRSNSTCVEDVAGTQRAAASQSEHC
jgi:hypothetical protein